MPMTLKPALAFALALTLAVLPGAAPAQDNAPFYKGKTIRIVMMGP